MLMYQSGWDFVAGQRDASPSDRGARYGRNSFKEGLSPSAAYDLNTGNDQTGKRDLPARAFTGKQKIGMRLGGHDVSLGEEPVIPASVLANYIGRSAQIRSFGTAVLKRYYKTTSAMEPRCIAILVSPRLLSPPGFDHTLNTSKELRFAALLGLSVLLPISIASFRGYFATAIFNVCFRCAGRWSVDHAIGRWGFVNRSWGCQIANRARDFRRTCDCRRSTAACGIVDPGGGIFGSHPGRVEDHFTARRSVGLHFVRNHRHRFGAARTRCMVD